MTPVLDSCRRGTPVRVQNIIDMHGHIGRYRFAICDLSVESLVRCMDRLGVRSIVCSSIQCLSYDQRNGNRLVLDAMLSFPGRILGYLSVRPWPRRKMRDEILFGLDNGFAGFKLYNAIGFRYSDPAYAPVYEAADAHRMPILFHTWGEPETFTDIKAAALCHKNAFFLLAHSGAVNPNAYIEAAAGVPNIYLETCFSRAPAGLIEKLVAGAGVEKIVWGSDAYFYSQAQQMGRVAGARLSEDEKSKILSVNARRILSARRS